MLCITKGQAVGTWRKAVVKPYSGAWCLFTDFQGNGAVVRARDVGVYPGRPNLGRQDLAHEEIVYTPAHVAGTGIGEMRPPTVMPVAFGENTECVHESGLDNRIDALPFFLGETMFALICLRIGQIVCRVRHIEVSAENNRLFLL